MRRHLPRQIKNNITLVSSVQKTIPSLSCLFLSSQVFANSNLFFRFVSDMGHFNKSGFFEMFVFFKNWYTAEYWGIHNSFGSVFRKIAGIFRNDTVGFSRTICLIANPTVALILVLDFFSFGSIPSTYLSRCFFCVWCLQKLQ